MRGHFEPSQMGGFGVIRRMAAVPRGAQRPRRPHGRRRCSVGLAPLPISQLVASAFPISLRLCHLLPPNLAPTRRMLARPGALRYGHRECHCCMSAPAYSAVAVFLHVSTLIGLTLEGKDPSGV